MVLVFVACFGSYFGRLRCGELLVGFVFVGAFMLVVV